MKSVAVVLITILILCLSFHTSTAADPDGPSAKGNFKISIDGVSQEIQFEARVMSNGNTTGEITFHDIGSIVTNTKTTPDGNASEAVPPFYAKASCNCLVVQGIEAALSGIVTESSRKDYIGRDVVLVVQDGDSLKPPLRDKLTFGFYRTPAKGWLATDGELPEDQAAAPTWIATDAERADDTGTFSQKDERVTCHSFPISAYSFIGAKQGKGKIQVSR